MTDTIKFPTLLKTSAQLKYAILRHEGIDSPHFDLMFETAAGSALSTWRSDLWPIKQTVAIVKLSDHRPDYLTYEGPISGNRGHVRRIVAGSYLLDRRSPDVWHLTFREGIGYSRLEFRQIIEQPSAVSDRWSAHPLT